MKPLCIYHGNCADGFGAAWVFSRHSGQDFDDRPEASDLLNLAALCQRCHNGHDAQSRRQGIKERREAASGQGRLIA